MMQICKLVVWILRVGGIKKELTPSRRKPFKKKFYDPLTYRNIKDNTDITIDKTTEITYDMANGIPNGWNNGTQTSENTYLVVPGTNPPGPGPQPLPDPEDNDNVKILNNLNKDPINSAIDAGEVYTPVAFAADLDEEIDSGVRKNVDGSVTVVKAFTRTK